MKSLFSIILSGMFILYATSCNPTGIKKEMVQFDQAFIPVLYFAYSGNMDSAKEAMPILQKRWQEVNKKLRQVPQPTDDWNESIRLVGAWLEEANDAMKDEEVNQVLFQLDHARYELMDLRWREGIHDYYLDYLWELEAAISVAIETSSDPMLDLLEWNEFVAVSQDVKQSWEYLLDQSLNEGQFDLNASQKIAMANRKAILGQKIKSFLNSIQTADRLQFAATAKEIEPAYFNYLSTFGDFESIQFFYASTH